MALREIQYNGAPLSIVRLPGEELTPAERKLWFRSVEMTVEDAVAAVSSPFTGQVQTFEWPGAELWSAVCEMPPMTTAQAAKWEAALLQCRGMLNPFLLGDARYDRPAEGSRVDGKSQPVCDTGSSPTANLQMSRFLSSRGWKPSAARLLLAGSYLQVDWNLYRLLSDVSSDANGNAVLEVWPTLRFRHADGAAIILNRPRGLFRLATNKRTYSFDKSRLSRMSFQVTEYR